MGARGIQGNERMGGWRRQAAAIVYDSEMTQSWVRDNILASRHRQRDNVLRASMTCKMRTNVNPRCQNGVATT